MVKDILNSKHYTWGNTCDSWVLCDEENLNVKFEKMPPDTKEQLHYHQNAKQLFFILNGTATFSVANETFVAKKQQGITIQPLVKHQIANTSDVDLEFLVISQPAINNDRVNV
jgi:mannose-6-phosphate isomerase-like protein (cupin superfamily)